MMTVWRFLQGEGLSTCIILKKLYKPQQHIETRPRHNKKRNLNLSTTQKKSLQISTRNISTTYVSPTTLPISNLQFTQFVPNDHATYKCIK